MRPILVILAAGAGTRYGGLKQLAPIGPTGESLLEYSAFDALRAGFDRIVLVVRPETEAIFRERLDERMAERVPIAYVHQRPDGAPAAAGRRTKPWGTGQAVLAVESQVSGPFGVINADDFYDGASFVALSKFLADAHQGRRLAVVGFSLARTLTDAGAVSRALLEVDGESRLRSILEHREVWRQGERIVYRDSEGRELPFGGDEVVSMNMWGFTPELLPELQRRFGDFLARLGTDQDSEFLLPEVIQDLVAEESFEVEVLPGGSRWCGITFREDQERAKSFISSLVELGEYPEELWG